MITANTININENNSQKQFLSKGWINKLYKPQILNSRQDDTRDAVFAGV